jgi:nitrogen fixation/metabolism regulation signal transduction histidine kinase
MTPVMTTFAIVFLVISVLAVLAALVLALAALAPLVKKPLAKTRQHSTLVNASEVWEQADNRLSKDGGSWGEVLTPIVLSLSQVRARDIEQNLVLFSLEAK